MREYLLETTAIGTAVNINSANLNPYNWVLNTENGLSNMVNTQEGLALKTYQSDQLNNWLNTDWIEGSGSVSDVTKVSTAGNVFTIDALNLAEKMYEMLNRVMVSGGTYDDWLKAVYTHESYTRCETPMYQGGLIKELVFQEVVSNAQAEGTDGAQPLGTLAGKGIMAKKHKGGKMIIKVNEPGYIMGIVSITPRIDYSQGNDWDINLKTVDDLHKPGLDGIGFQNLMTEQMAWWSTNYVGVVWAQVAVGKQPEGEEAPIEPYAIIGFKPAATRSLTER